jgi:hypothetical protein
MNLKPTFAILFLFVAAFSCAPAAEEPLVDSLPYFDLRAFLDLELKELDGMKVTKTSEINGEKQVVKQVYTEQDWKEELDYFYAADINLPSLATSYSTKKYSDNLIHKLLPDAKGKVKELSVSFSQNYPAWITFRIKEEYLFYTTTTLGEASLNQSTGKIDFYSLETTQKVMFLSPTHIKISGVIQ